MPHKELHIEAVDGVRLHVDHWAPQGAPKFAVAVVHGGAEHAFRYDVLAQHWNAQGGLVFGPDHRGQGLSEGPRGHVVRFEDYARDVRQVIDGTIAELPESARPDAIPWFIFGHSMGGLITLGYLLDHQQAVPLCGAMISAPLLGLTMKVGAVKRFVGEMAAKVVPKLTLPSGIPPEAICRDPQVVAAYVADTRRVPVVSAGWFMAMQAMIARVEREIGNVSLPMRWYVGTGDQICDPEATRRMFARLHDPTEHNQTMEEFEGYYHELHNEPAELREPVIAMLDAWIAARS